MIQSRDMLIPGPTCGCHCLLLLLYSSNTMIVLSLLNPQI
jgi:hypothetical protein